MAASLPHTPVMSLSMTRVLRATEGDPITGRGPLLAPCAMWPSHRETGTVWGVTEFVTRICKMKKNTSCATRPSGVQQASMRDSFTTNNI